MTKVKKESINAIADLFKVFGDSTRLKILYSLYDKELCVKDIANILDMNQSAISHQLKTLRQNKLIKYERNGKTILYSLADKHVYSIISSCAEHIEE